MPSYLKVTNTGQASTAVSEIIFDQTRGGVPGIIELEGCECGSCPFPSEIDTCCTGGTDLQKCIGPGITPQSSTGDEIKRYIWTALLQRGSNRSPASDILFFCARIDKDAVRFPGTVMQVWTNGSSNGTISIPVADLKAPDLSVSSFAEQTCDIITYTLHYLNYGGINQTNTYLVGHYDPNSLTVIDNGGGDVQIDHSGNATIAWNLGIVPKEAEPLTK